MTVSPMPSDDTTCACLDAPTEMDRRATGDMEQCRFCGTAVAWNKVDDPFFGFITGPCSTVMKAEEEKFIRFLRDECLYLDPRLLPGGRYACVYRLLYTHAIITGKIGNTGGFDDRWCYENYASAWAALDAWDGEGEPSGWHRHPGSGHRRPNGEAALEYIEP